MKRLTQIWLLDQSKSFTHSGEVEVGMGFVVGWCTCSNMSFVF